MSKLDIVEAFGRGTMVDESGFEASARKSKGWILLVAIHQQSPRNLQCTHFLPWGGHKELAVRPSSISGNLNDDLKLTFTELNLSEIKILSTLGKNYQQKCTYIYIYL